MSPPLESQQEVVFVQNGRPHVVGWAERFWRPDSRQKDEHSKIFGAAFAKGDVHALPGRHVSSRQSEFLLSALFLLQMLFFSGSC